MKVFHVISSLGVGGTEKQLELLLPHLQKYIHNEVVCLIGHGPIGKVLEQHSIPVHYLEGKNNTDIRIPIRLWKLLRHHRPTVVITYLIYADIIGRIIGRLAGIKTIIESHRSSLFGSPWWHHMDRFTRWLVTHYTSQTEVTKKLIYTVIKVPLSKITVIPNAVLTPTVPKQTAPNLVITCVANLKPEKDLHVLLQAFELLHPHYPHVRLWLVGEGPERTRLENQIVSYQSKNNIHFLGLRNDISHILTQSSIFVLPTRIEGMSNALLEALATGLPCLASDIPVNTEVITSGHNGLLFKTSDAQDLAVKLKTLLDNEKLGLKLGQVARNDAQKTYSIETIVHQWLDLLNKVG